jgi:hypothetical protein
VIELSSLLVRSFDLDHLDVFWEFKDTPAKVDRYSVFVERSVDGPLGPFRQIAGPFYNTGQLRDPDVNQLNNHRKYFYRLHVLDKDTGEDRHFGPKYHEAEPDLYALELRRRFAFVMREHAGRRCFIFPSLTSGFRCSVCYQKNDRGMGTGRKLTQNCVTCFDTTFIGGFTTPIAEFIQFDPNPEHTVRTDTYERQPENTSGRLSAFPPLKAKDMIVEAENIRWEVENVVPTKKGRAVSRQEITLHRIPKSDVRYKVPVNTDLLQQFGPEREFTRPMSLPDEETEFEGGPLSTFLDRFVD